MEMSRESGIVRWAFHGERVPERVSLCVLFWRFVFNSIGALIVIGFAIVAVGLIGLMMVGIVMTWPTVLVWASVVFGVTMCLASIFAPSFLERRELQKRSDFKPSFIEEVAVAYKRKICLIIELREQW